MDTNVVPPYGEVVLPHGGGTDPVSPRTYRQIAANRIILDMIEREGISIASDARLVDIVRQGRSVCHGYGWDAAADELIGMIRRGDLVSLRGVLTSPAGRYYHLRTLSPLIGRYGTSEIRAEVRRQVPRNKVLYR